MVIGTKRTMDGDPALDVRKALIRIGSLISKSEKALRRLDPDTWQHAMLQDSLKALRLAQALLDPRADDVPGASREDLRQGLGALDATIGRVERTKAFAPGTSAHTLKRNRLNALRIARGALEAELARPADATARVLSGLRRGPAAVQTDDRR